MSAQGGRRRSRGTTPADANESILTAQETPKTADSTRLWTADYLAERWEVPKAHVYRLTRRGEIPNVKLGRYVRYRPESIMQWELEKEGLGGS